MKFERNKLLRNKRKGEREILPPDVNNGGRQDKKRKFSRMNTASDLDTIYEDNEDDQTQITNPPSPPALCKFKYSIFHT
jgi:hypothetical protein